MRKTKYQGDLQPVFPRIFFGEGNAVARLDVLFEQSFFFFSAITTH